MRLIAIFLTALLILVQYPLWLGKGGWLRVWDMDQQVHAAHDKVDELKARNAKLDSEVHDLKEGTGAVEERARTELGMIKKEEIFIQILDPNGNPADAPAPPNAELTAIEKTIAVAVPSEKNKKSEP
ncbi:MAG: cell division protein FtsB [Collimonas sp.]